MEKARERDRPTERDRETDCERGTERDRDQQKETDRIGRESGAEKKKIVEFIFIALAHESKVATRRPLPGHTIPTDCE